MASVGRLGVMPDQPALLARGPWSPDEVETTWRDDAWEPSAALARSADDAIDALRDRGSPSHDGLAARLAGYRSGLAAGC